ncbi:MAG TPA: hypothetical protein VGL61_04715 [Kofleriaceae bacterium]|jgi:hypothetical protein
MRLAVIAVLVAGCATHTSQQEFAIELGATPIDIEAPTMLLVQIVTVGGDATSVTSANLPAFATLTAQTITLDPGYADAGDYSIDLVATTTDGDTAEGTLLLHVTRANTGPMWLPVPMYIAGPALEGAVCDMEGDNFTFELSVAPLGQQPADTPDFTANVDFSVTPPLPYELPNNCANIVVDLTGLASGQYVADMYAIDVLGAPDPYGWVPVPDQFTEP